MIDLSIPLIGPIKSVVAVMDQLAKKQHITVLLDGDPGVGKSHALDQFALSLTKSRFAIEQINGQSVSVEVVRFWRDHNVYGNLFSEWTVKRIDELDQVRGAAMAEMLTYLDYLQPHTAILASTNDYSRLRAESKGRLETRFVRLHVDAPSIEQATACLVKHFKVPVAVAKEIAVGNVPDGYLPSEGVNMRSCIEDVRAFLAARSVKRKAA